MKNAVIPSAWCSKLGFPVAYGDGGKKIAHDLGRPPVPMDKQKWGRILVANKETLQSVLVTEKNKHGGRGVTLYNFILNAVKESQKGFLTMADLRDLAGLTAVNPNAGHPRFREPVNKIVADGHLISEKGRGVTDAGEEIDWSADVDDADIDQLFS